MALAIPLCLLGYTLTLIIPHHLCGTGNPDVLANNLRMESWLGLRAPIFEYCLREFLLITQYLAKMCFYSFGRTLNQHHFRPARKEDCLAIAALYRISSDGVADYIWTKLAEPGDDILTVGQRRYEREDSVFSYRNCTLVEAGGEIIGMLVAFPMHTDPDESTTDPVLVPYSKLEEDNSYYICGMALTPGHRGQGIGSQLLAIAEQKACEQGFRKMSLVVFEQNTGAKRLYERHGYSEAGRAPVFPHPLIHYTGDALLMVKEVAAG